jgi:hypothetical protein
MDGDLRSNRVKLLCDPLVGAEQWMIADNRSRKSGVAYKHTLATVPTTAGERDKSVYVENGLPPAGEAVEQLHDFALGPRPKANLARRHLDSPAEHEYSPIFAQEPQLAHQFLFVVGGRVFPDEHELLADDDIPSFKAERRRQTSHPDRLRYEPRCNGIRLPCRRG